MSCKRGITERKKSIKQDSSEAGGLACYIGEREDTHPFGRRLNELMNISIRELADRMEVSPTTVKKLKKYDYMGDRASIQVIICTCVALKLPYYESSELLQLAGYYLRNTYQDRIYMYILQNPGLRTVGEWNEFLIQNNIMPLRMEKRWSEE